MASHPFSPHSRSFNLFGLGCIFCQRSFSFNFFQFIIYIYNYIYNWYIYIYIIFYFPLFSAKMAAKGLCSSFAGFVAARSGNGPKWRNATDAKLWKAQRRQRLMRTDWYDTFLGWVTPTAWVASNILTCYLANPVQWILFPLLVENYRHCQHLPAAVNKYQYQGQLDMKSRVPLVCSFSFLVPSHWHCSRWSISHLTAKYACCRGWVDGYMLGSRAGSYPKLRGQMERAKNHWWQVSGSGGWILGEAQLLWIFLSYIDVVILKTRFVDWRYFGTFWNRLDVKSFHIIQQLGGFNHLRWCWRFSFFFFN